MKGLGVLARSELPPVRADSTPNAGPARVTGSFFQPLGAYPPSRRRDSPAGLLGAGYREWTCQHQPTNPRFSVIWGLFQITFLIDLNAS
jgi:hypothetical protein